MSGELFFAEVVGAGVALVDIDGDDDLDLYLVQGNMLGAEKDLSEATFAPRHSPPLSDRVYRNELQETGSLHFTDVTEGSGLDHLETGALGYGMGVASGDFDNDGRVDLYVTNLGANQLWRNETPVGAGQPTFRNVTAESGAGDERWSTSAAFLDFDRDGWLDLFVTNYVNYRIETHKGCLNQSGVPEYCGPQSYQGEADRLLRNRGDGTFEDVSFTSGIGRERGSGLGVVVADFDANGWNDMYVANDLMRNQLWLNQGDGTFVNDALLAGAAVGSHGQAQASMGVDAGDLDNDGDFDLFMTHLSQDTNTVYMNSGSAVFRDGTTATRLGQESVEFTGFGTAMLDWDNDGRLDLVVANGAVKTLTHLQEAGDPFPLHQPNQLFHNVGFGGAGEALTYPEFVDLSYATEAFAVSELSRGLAVGDLDNDGDPDIVVTNNNGPARILVNQVGQAANWLGLRALTSDRRRDALGARVEVTTADGAKQVRRVRTDASYCSAVDPRALFGLGASSSLLEVQVAWPSGRTESWSSVAPGQYLTLVEGEGTPADVVTVGG